jgi:hypothetical protein
MKVFYEAVLNFVLQWGVNNHLHAPSISSSRKKKSFSVFRIKGNVEPRASLAFVEKGKMLSPYSEPNPISRVLQPET